jgi:hypothetical protein
LAPKRATGKESQFFIISSPSPSLVSLHRNQRTSQ